jgi:hypothetical protein
MAIESPNRADFPGLRTRSIFSREYEDFARAEV